MSSNVKNSEKARGERLAEKDYRQVLVGKSKYNEAKGKPSNPHHHPDDSVNILNHEGADAGRADAGRADLGAGSTIAASSSANTNTSGEKNTSNNAQAMAISKQPTARESALYFGNPDMFGQLVQTFKSNFQKLAHHAVVT
jgi:hypothetical protein